MKVLLLGGSGFVGKNIREYGTAHEIIAPTHKQVDLRVGYMVKDCISYHKPDMIIKSAFGTTLQDNSVMALNVYKYGKDVPIIFNLSSGAVYNCKKSVFNLSESDISRRIPTDTYGYNKYMEMLYRNSFPNVHDLYLFGIYGVYEEPQRFITSYIQKTLEGKPPVIYQNRRMSWISAPQATRMIFKLALAPSLPQAINLTTVDTDLISMARSLQGIIGGTQAVIEKTGLQPDYTANNTLLRTLLFDEPYDILDRSTIENMYAYIKEKHDAKRSFR